MMFSAGYFHARFLLSAFFSFFPTVFVPDLYWCNFLYLATTAGFVTDQLRKLINNNVCDFVSFFVFLFFTLSSSCDIGEPGMGSAPLSFLGS